MRKKKGKKKKKIYAKNSRRIFNFIINRFETRFAFVKVSILPIDHFRSRCSRNDVSFYNLICKKKKKKESVRGLAENYSELDDSKCARVARIFYARTSAYNFNIGILFVFPVRTEYIYIVYIYRVYILIERRDF